MNAFVCSVKSYSEVGRRNYLVASDKRVRLLFGNWFRNPPKEHKLGGKLSEKTSFQVRAGPVKRTETKHGLETLKNSTLLQNDGALLSVLQCNALASLVHFAHNRVN